METVASGQFRSHIVGRQYYTGLTSVSECIELRREPSNIYDPNAIAVYNSSLEQTGHLSRWLAEILAPCIDDLECTVDGTVAGVGNAYTTPIHLTITAPAHMADKLRAHLGSYWYLWQMGNQQTASRLTTPFSNSLHDSAMQIIAGQTSRSGVGDRTLVITTAHGIQRWTKLVSSGSAAQAVECSVFERKLADACDAKRQLMLVHFSDAVLAVARSGGSFWSMVVLDRTSIRNECGSVDLSPLFQVLDLGTAVFIYVL